MLQLKRYDLHMHSRRSPDSALSAKRIIALAKQRGLSGIAVTDHGTIAGGLDAAALAPPDLLVIVGAEIYTLVGDIVCLFLTSEIVGRDPLDVIAQTHQQGGVAFLPHPLRSHPPLIPREVLEACDGFEVLNSRAGWFSPENAPSRGTDWRALSGKTRLANSDAHLGSEIGAAYTLIDGPATAENVKQALLRGMTSIGGARGPTHNFYLSQLIRVVKTRDVAMLARLARRAVRRVSPTTR